MAVRSNIVIVVEVDVVGIVNVVITGLMVSSVATQELPLCVYPVLHDTKVQLPESDQVPKLQIRDCEPVPLVILQDEVVEPEQVRATQELPLCVYPVSQEIKVQAPYEDNVPTLQVLDLEPCPLVIVQDAVNGSEQVIVTVTVRLIGNEIFPDESKTQA